jgi:16S rRNA (cytosine1402-N4)-methyltransferase
MDENNQEKYVRRVRYNGSHPRTFTEKYKELSPEQYGETIEKVVSRGQTPAGTHIPICPAEILLALDIRPGIKVLDATLGYGGHSGLILEKMQGQGLLVGVDVDPLELPKTEARLRRAGWDESVFKTRRMNFAAIASLSFEFGPFDAVLADLGVSSMQLDNPERGFTFKVKGPLDLRLNPNKGVPVSEMIQKMSEKELSLVLFENADEPHHLRLAASIYKKRFEIHTTQDLNNLIRHSLQGVVNNAEDMKNAVQRCFQALRIAVNEEFIVLDRFLDALPSILSPHGKVAILTFHSGEDRRVKKSFQKLYRAGIYSGISDGCIRPSFEEQENNPRSRCAKLRYATRAG